MSQYVIVYTGGFNGDQVSTPEDAKEHQTRYMTWLEGLGDAAVSPMNPLLSTSTINPNGSIEEGSKMSMSGFTIIEADSLDDVISMAKDCPFLDVGGSLEVSELMRMRS
jgi:hypothetical protein